MDKRELLKLRKRLDAIKEELSETLEWLNERFTQEEQAVLNYEASIGRNGTALGELKGEALKDYATSCQKYLDFGKEVDACMANVLQRGTVVRVGEVSVMLERVGFDKKSMYITQKHIKDILQKDSVVTSHYHGIDIRQLKQLPELLETPLAILESEKDEKTLVAVLDAEDWKEDLLIVPIQKNGSVFYKGGMEEANCILSVYGKRDIERYIDKGIAEGRLLYADKKISTRLRKVSRQLRQTLSTGTYINNILQTERKVNDSARKSEKNNIEVRDNHKRAERNVKL